MRDGPARLRYPNAPARMSHGRATDEPGVRHESPTDELRQAYELDEMSLRIGSGAPLAPMMLYH